MHVLGTLILPSASKMCIFFFPLTRKKKKKKNSTRKLVTLLDGSKPSFSPLSLSKYLLYDTYIYISIYILQKEKGKKSQLWRYILQCITCLRTTAVLVVPHTEILVRKLKLQWLRDTRETNDVSHHQGLTQAQRIWFIASRNGLLQRLCEQFKNLFSTNQLFIWALTPQSLLLKLVLFNTVISDRTNSTSLKQSENTCRLQNIHPYHVLEQWRLPVTPKQNANAGLWEG